MIDLKTGKLSYQDVGQIDFYVRYFEDKVKAPHDNERLFASKYMLYLPSEEELKQELERERRLIESSIEENEDRALDSQC